jgi:hypothetical protein
MSRGSTATQLPALEPQVLLVMFLSSTEHLVPSRYSSVAEPNLVEDEFFPTINQRLLPINQSLVFS